jgi:hypothetical protein
MSLARLPFTIRAQSGFWSLGFQAYTNPKSTFSKSTPPEIKLIFRVIDGFNLELQDFFFSYLLKVKLSRWDGSRSHFSTGLSEEISGLHLKRFQIKYQCSSISPLIPEHLLNSIGGQSRLKSGQEMTMPPVRDSHSCSPDKEASSR